MTAHDHAVTHAVNRRRLTTAFAVTVTILVAEVVGAWWTGSLALLVDAGHMLVDAGGLGMALVAANLAARPATAERTWGYRRAEVLAAAAQALVLFAVGVYALIEGIRRLSAPPDVPAGGLLVFGVVGLIGNIVAIVVLAGGRTDNLNMRAAFLEVLNDALGSVAVIVSAVVIATTSFESADAIAAMFISLLILPRTVVLLRESADVLLESTPRGLDLQAVRDHILELEHVVDVHDLHASQIATGLPVLSAHVVLEDSCFHDGHAPRVLDQLQACVAEHFPVSVAHSTFQLEPAGHVNHEPHHHD
jgi:cobalt-zinc-cadmium efflux system protein